MLKYSLASLLMAVLASNLIIVIIALCFQHKKIGLAVGYKVLLVLLFMALARFAFPFELPVARTIPLPEAISVLFAFIEHPFAEPYGIRISLWTLFEIIWAIGVIYHLCLYVKECIISRGLVAKRNREATQEEPYASLLAEICGKRRNRFRVLLSESVVTPCLYGIVKPYILIPASMPLTKEDLYYVLSHELSHHFYHDLMAKQIVRLLSVIYWWNPICNLLRKQVNLLLEMRIDNSLVKKDPRVMARYVSTLVHIVEMAEDNISHSNAESQIAMFGKDAGALTQRVNMMLRERKMLSMAISLLLFSLVALIYVGSYLFSFGYVHELAPNPHLLAALLSLLR